MAKFTKSTIKPRGNILLINEKNQVAWYRNGFCYFPCICDYTEALDEKPKKIVELGVMHIETWCKKYLPLKDICNKELYEQLGGNTAHNKESEVWEGN